MVRAVLAVAAALALVAGCGDDEPAASTTSDADAVPFPTTARGAEVPEAPAEDAQAGARLVRVGRFAAPVYVTAPPGDRRRLFVVEQAGTIRVVRDGRKLSRPFLDIRGDVLAGGERGLLSMAFPPDYGSSGRFYVYFTGRDGDIRIQEFRRASADTADRSTRRQLLRIEHSQAGNHNGGQLQFGPDRLLYIGTGDGGGGGDTFRNAQNKGRLLGKLLRVDPRRSGGRPYGIPATNPFRGSRGARGEVYSYGLRNPWRFSFDRATGAINIADVGQNAVEEVNYAPRGGARGRNFGWPKFEGRRRYEGGAAPGHLPPVIQRFHSQGSCSITGGYVVRDPGLRALRGRYVYSDICDGRILSARLQRGRATANRSTGLRVGSPSSFGEDARGRVYVASLNGPVFRLAAR